MGDKGHIQAFKYFDCFQNLQDVSGHTVFSKLPEILFKFQRSFCLSLPISVNFLKLQPKIYDLGLKQQVSMTRHSLCKPLLLQGSKYGKHCVLFMSFC